LAKTTKPTNGCHPKKEEDEDEDYKRVKEDYE
jgi:hypothetical protein